MAYMQSAIYKRQADIGTAILHGKKKKKKPLRALGFWHRRGDGGWGVNNNRINNNKAAT